ncbi:eukaryotic aspartyl protease family protein [Artemisia annua]|uniref:Eukaryotic aspartyl protease family protein n=1 Tax=Artemisia annua TaxID=35608 RepID=A0A2U1MGD4_ARTAN|nr:eukaryotic aspartyl protease family protein [Artemisia annua]
MSSNDDQDHSHLKGFVIITLPPADNPSLGKTITAFTLSNHPQNQPQNHPQNQPQNQPSNLPISLNRPRSNFVTYPRRRISFTIMGILLFAFLTFISIQSPQNLLKLGSLTEVDQDNDEKESNQTNSIVFPLYSKLGFGGMMDKRDMEVKLGKFMMFGSKSSVLPLDDGVVGSKVVASSSAVLPVNGDELRDGLYYTQIDVGNPPRPYFLDVDTGSDLTWIQCDAPCTSCAKGAHPYYKPARGNILSSKDSYCYDVQQNSKSGHCESCSQCDYEIEYADHSSSLGVLSKDDLRLVRMNDTSVNSEVIFGCAYDQQGILLNSLTKTDGILGLSRAKVSLPSQLAKQGIVDNVIGHCLASDSVSGGYMFLGGDIVPQGKMSWVPMLNDASMNYLAEVSRVSYGSKQLGLDRQRKGNGRIVFDSGSSYTYFTKQAYSDLVSNLKDVSRDGFVLDDSDATLPICWQPETPISSIKEVSKLFKPLTLQFGRKWWTVSTYLHIPPEGYLIISNKRNVCLGILDGSDLLDGSHIVLGDISVRGNLIVYDNVRHKIGWMRSECVNPKQSNTYLPFL